MDKTKKCNLNLNQEKYSVEFISSCSKTKQQKYRFDFFIQNSYKKETLADIKKIYPIFFFAYHHLTSQT